MSVIVGSGMACGIGDRERQAAPGQGCNGQQIRPPRGWSPAVSRRAALLPQRDRAILELTIGANLSRGGVARALSTTPGQVSRRLRVLYARLFDPLVIALCDDRCPLATEHRQLGIEHHLLGLSSRQLADKHRMPLGEVRRALIFIRGWHKGAAESVR